MEPLFWLGGCVVSFYLGRATAEYPRPTLNNNGAAPPPQAQPKPGDFIPPIMTPGGPGSVIPSSPIPMDCNAAIALLPPAYQSAFSTAMTTGVDSVAMNKLADTLDAAGKMYVEPAGSAFTKAAQCLRDRAKAIKPSGLNTAINPYAAAGLQQAPLSMSYSPMSTMYQKK